MRNIWLNEAQAEIKIANIYINNLSYADDTCPHGRKWRGSKEPLESDKAGLKINIQ